MNKTSQNKRKEEKHKISPNCFNRCVEWKLNASITHNKTSIGYVLFNLIYIINSYLMEKAFFLGNWKQVFLILCKIITRAQFRKKLSIANHVLKFLKRNQTRN